MAGKLPNALVGYRGDDIKHVFRFREPVLDVNDPVVYIDFTGWTGTSQIRQVQDSADILGAFTVTVDPDQVTNRGQIKIEMTDTVSALVPPGKWKWDLQMVNPGGEKDTLIYADYKMVGDVTRP